jgi:hypothetical protein
MTQSDCACPGPGWCNRHAREVTRTGWKICQGGLASSIARYFDPKPDIPRPTAACVHLGDQLRDEEGKRETVECVPCGGKTRLFVYACDHPKHDTTTLEACKSCPDYRPKPEPLVQLDPPPANRPGRRLKLVNKQAAGDAVVITMAIESLHRTYPGRFATAVETLHDPVFWFNPLVEWPAPHEGGWETFDLHYPLIRESNRLPIHFGEAFSRHLGQLLGLPLSLATNRPHLHLSEAERAWDGPLLDIAPEPVPFVLLAAGHKVDFTTKATPPRVWEAVAQRLRAAGILPVQIGATGKDHHQTPIPGCVDLVGATGVRALVRLAWHATAAAGPSTLLQHLAAAWQRPYVLVDAAREPRSWTTYPTQVDMTRHARHACCAAEACWRSKVRPDRLPEDEDCVDPVAGEPWPVARCVSAIDPDQVAETVVELCRERGLQR